MKNQLYYGDNLKILRDYIQDESIDLIYLDPPFNSNRLTGANVQMPLTARTYKKAQRESIQDATQLGLNM